MPEINYNTSLDDLISDLSTPKQDFTTKPPAPVPGQPQQKTLSGLWPEPENQIPEIDARTPEQIQLDIQAAERTGMRIAKTVDGIASFSAAILAKEQETAKYKATEGDIKDLASAWGAVSEKYQFDVNPWFTVAFLNLTVYGPIFMKASNDRRFNQMNNEIKAIQQQLEDLKKEKEKAEK